MSKDTEIIEEIHRRVSLVGQVYALPEPRTLAEMLAFHRVERDAQSLGAAMHALERAWADPVIGKRSMGEMLAAKRWELLRIPCV